MRCKGHEMHEANESIQLNWSVGFFFSYNFFQRQMNGMKHVARSTKFQNMVPHKCFSVEYLYMFGPLKVTHFQFNLYKVFHVKLVLCFFFSNESIWSHRTMMLHYVGA